MFAGVELWIPITIGAAFVQAIRFGLQKQLKATRLTTTGTTFARFVYSAPLIVLLAWVYVRASGQAWPDTSVRFWAFALTGGICQIVATMAIVALFAHRNFAVGVALIKTEVILSVLMGIILLGEGVSGWGLVAILIGVMAVILLSDPPDARGNAALRLFNRAAGLGLLSGALFAVSAVSYRGATLALSHGDAMLRGSVTLAYVSTFQLTVLAVWLVWRDRREIGRVAQAWPIASLVGLTSMLGSLGWFVAFALQTAALIKALGQIELAFVLIGSVVFFRERLTGREWLGLALLSASVILLVLRG